MRKLLFVTIPAFLVAVPAVSLAAPEPSTAPGDDPSLVSSSLVADPLAPIAALKEGRTAVTRAKRDAKPPAPPAPAVPPHLESIAACESGGDPTAVGGGGLYRGKYQFSVETWQAVGGTGDPAAAPEAEQDRRAAILYAQSGAGQWPVCGS